MSAIVYPECGHASHLMEVDSMRGCPQVHIHFLTEQWEYERLGFMKAELCCHGCGHSVLLYYLEVDEDDTRHMDFRNRFLEKHSRCPNRGYESVCPNYRSSFEVMDFRRTKRRAKKSQERAPVVEFKPPLVERKTNRQQPA